MQRKAKIRLLFINKKFVFISKRFTFNNICHGPGFICRGPGFLHNLKSLHHSPICIKSVNRDGCPEWLCGSRKLLNSNFMAFKHFSPKRREFCRGSGLIQKLDSLRRKQIIKFSNNCNSAILFGKNNNKH